MNRIVEVKNPKVWTQGYFYIHRLPFGPGTICGFTFQLLPCIEVRHSCGNEDGHTQTIIEFRWLLWGWQICFNAYRRIKPRKPSKTELRLRKILRGGKK